jgi:hypothetical protein
VTEDEFDRVIATYPYPITGIFSRLGTIECLDLGDRRFNCILDTAEAVTRFLSALALCLCRDYAEANAVSPSAPLDQNFYQSLKRPSWGHWLHFTREGIKWLKGQGEPEPLVTRLADFFFDRLPRESHVAQALGRLLTVRNDVEHGRKPAHYAPQLKALCEETHADLVTVIGALGFLADYNLNFVHQIEVWKRHRRDPDFRHRLVRIRAGGGDFRATEKSFASALESRAVIFRQGGTGPYLNLDPLLVYEHASGAAPDLFFYNGMANPTSLRYVACKHGGEFDSSRSARAEDSLKKCETCFGC